MGEAGRWNVRVQDLLGAPAYHAAEAKIARAAALVKSFGTKTETLMYFQNDWARTWYDSGAWFDAHPEVSRQPCAFPLCRRLNTALTPRPSLPAPLRAINSLDSLNSTLDAAYSALSFRESRLRWYSPSSRPSLQLELRDRDGKFVSVVEYNHSFRAYDFSSPTAQEAWVNASMVLVAEGVCDGVFVDGYRGPIWRFEILKDCSIQKQTEWINGMNRATDVLAARLGPNRLLVNNPYSAARPSANGVMIEFFGRNFLEPSSEKPGNLLIDIELLQAEGRVGRVIAAHMNSNDRTHFNATLAAFLAGAEQNAYLGTGTDWEDCDDWATPRGVFTLGGCACVHSPPGRLDFCGYCAAEWTKPLGPPLSGPTFAHTDDAVVVTRTFASGTHVRLRVKASRAEYIDSCIWWADGTNTGSNCTSS